MEFRWNSGQAIMAVYLPTRRKKKIEKQNYLMKQYNKDMLHSFSPLIY